MPSGRRDPQSSYFRQNLQPRGRRPKPHRLKDLIEKCPHCLKEIIFEEAVRDKDGDLCHPECIKQVEARNRRLADADPGMWEDLL